MYFDFSVIALLMSAAFSFFLSLLNFVYWVFRKEDKAHLWLSLWMTTHTVLVSGRIFQYADFNENIYPVISRIITSAAFFIIFPAMNFANEYKRKVSRRTEQKIVSSGLIVIFFLLWCTDLILTDQVIQRTGSFNEPFYGVRLGSLYVFVFVAIMSYAAVLASRIFRSDRFSGFEKHIVFIGFICGFGFGLYDYAMIIMNVSWIRLYDFAGLPVGIMFNFAQVTRYAKLYNNMESVVRKKTSDLVNINDNLQNEIEERKSAEGKAKTQERLFRTLFDNAVDLMGSLSIDGRILSANNTALKFISCDFKDIKGRFFWETPWWSHSLALQEKLKKTISEAVSGVRLVSFEAENLDIDGKKRIVDFSIKPVIGDDGTPSLLIVESRDITARKHLEAQVLHAQKMDAIGKLAGGIAHDLNNLLTPVICHAELGLRKTSSDSNVYNDFTRIYKAALSAAGLARQILAFSRRQMLEMKSVDLNHVVFSFEKILSRLIGENISLDISLEESIKPVWADTSQVEQILLNLSINARDAMPLGGVLSITTRSAMIDENEGDGILDIAPGDYVCLEVSDNGQGIPEHLIGTIFEPFFTTKEKGKGTGLGLSTVHGIAKQHGGFVNVDSCFGHGSTFCVYLPVADSPAQASEKEEMIAESIYGNETILVVEDEETLLDMVSEVLESYGYKVIRAATPAAGLDAVFLYDDIKLLLTDIILPGISGKELCTKIASVMPGVRSLYMSGYTEDLAEYKDIRNSGENFLQKPFTVSDLLGKVKSSLRNIPSF